MTDPNVYPHVTDDYSPDADHWMPVEDERVWYVVVRDCDEILGLWMLQPQNQIRWQVHTCLLPCAYGPRAIKAVKEAITWLWEHSECLRIVTEVPQSNRLAHRFAKLAGMVQFGLDPASYMKDGKLEDVILLGISKPVTL